MRFAIDALFETPGAGTGGVTYLTSLVAAAPEVLHGDTLVVLCSARNRHCFRAGEGVELVQAGWSNEARVRRILSEQMLLDRAARASGCDVLLGAGNSVPIFGALPSVVVLHTLHWLLDSAFAGTVRSAYRRRMVEASCRKASRIIAVSQYLADVLLDWRPEFRDKTRVVLEGVSPAFCPTASPLDPFADVHAEGRRVVLFASTLLPYKNLDVAVRALGELRDDDSQLVVCGADFGGEMGRLRGLAEAAGVASRVTFLGHIAQSDMPAMFSWADVSVYPSRCEWFGLPLLEAMSSGVPVLAARTSSIPEVADGAAALFEADDYRTLARELFRALYEDDYRHMLIERGHRRAKELTWERTAASTFDVLREAAN